MWIMYKMSHINHLVTTWGGSSVFQTTLAIENTLILGTVFMMIMIRNITMVWNLGIDSSKLEFQGWQHCVNQKLWEELFRSAIVWLISALSFGKHIKPLKHLYTLKMIVYLLIVFPLSRVSSYFPFLFVNCDSISYF